MLTFGGVCFVVLDHEWWIDKNWQSRVNSVASKSMYGLEKVVLTSPTLSSTAETTEAHDYYNVVQQSMAYGAFHGGKDAGYVPTLGTSGDSLLDLLYEDSLQQKDWVRYQHQIRRLCGLRYFDRDLCLSVHGSDRQEIRVLHVSRGDNQEDSFTVTKHDKPVEEMYCNYNSNQHQKKLSSHPLIAVRSTSSIDYFKVHQSDENGKGTPVVLKRIHGASTTGTVHGGTIRDFSWNQYISSHGVAIEDSGMLFETDVSAMDGTHNIPSSRRSERLLDIKTKTSSTISSMGAIRCESSALHPHVTLVSWQDVLLKVDLREKNSVLSISSAQNHSTLLYDFSSRSDNMKHTCVTAFAVASRHAGASHTYAASTPSHVYLFDIRKPSKPIVTWEHNMKFPSTRVNSWYDMKSSGFHDLKFVTLRGEEDALLATNSYQGNAILLRWALSDEGEYIEFADGKISYKKIVDENKYRRCDLKFLKEGPLYFAWKPISFQRFEPILPPTLVYNNIYPAPAMPALTKWQDERNLSNQATVKCLEKEVRQLPTKKNPVCRDFGTLVLQRKWETNELALDPLLFRLGPFEEIIVGSLKHLGDPSSSTHVEKAINDDGLAFSIARQPNPACSRPESMAETKKDGSDSQADVNFQSSGYSLAFGKEFYLIWLCVYELMTSTSCLQRTEYGLQSMAGCFFRVRLNTAALKTVSQRKLMDLLQMRLDCFSTNYWNRLLESQSAPLKHGIFFRDV